MQNQTLVKIAEQSLAIIGKHLDVSDRPGGGLIFTTSAPGTAVTLFEIAPNITREFDVISVGPPVETIGTSPTIAGGVQLLCYANYGALMMDLEAELVAQEPPEASKETMCQTCLRLVPTASMATLTTCQSCKEKENQ